MKRIKLKEEPKFSHVDEFSGHKYYTFMNHTVELYTHIKKHTNRKGEEYETTEVSIEDIYTDEVDAMSPYLIFETEQVAWPTLYGHVIQSFTLWNEHKETSFKDIFCWIQYVIENPVK